VTATFTRRGAEFFVVITNDAWFQRSRAPYEHLYASVFRAIETRRPFVHAANTGVSGFIDAKGRILKTLEDRTGNELFLSGVLTYTVEPQKKKTVYVKWGGAVPLIALVLSWFGFTSVLVFRKAGDPHR